MDDEFEKKSKSKTNKSLQSNQKQLVGRPKLAKSNKQEWQDNKPVEENDTGSHKRERPKYFNWKCYDNFDKVPDDKLFYDCKTIKLTERQRALAGKEILKVREKYVKLIQAWYDEVHGNNKTHLTVAGGNYTFFFVLPSMIKWIRERYPFLGVNIQLFESGGAAELTEQDADILLTASTSSDPFDNKKILNAGYNSSRQTVQDSVFFAASKDSIDSFGSKENVLNDQDMIFGRFYHTRELNNEIVEHYSIVHPDRKGLQPRVIVDQYFLEYVMMKHSVGFGHLFTSMSLDAKTIILSKDSPETFKRVVLRKKSLSKKYNWLGRRLINSMKHKGKEK